MLWYTNYIKYYDVPTNFCNLDKNLLFIDLVSLCNYKDKKENELHKYEPNKLGLFKHYTKIIDKNKNEEDGGG
jgi:uncharacterized protein YfaT (DUF1175 family)